MRTLHSTGTTLITWSSAAVSSSYRTFPGSRPGLKPLKRDYLILLDSMAGLQVPAKLLTISGSDGRSSPSRRKLRPRLRSWREAASVIRF